MIHVSHSKNISDAKRIAPYSYGPGVDWVERDCSILNHFFLKMLIKYITTTGKCRKSDGCVSKWRAREGKFASRVCFAGLLEQKPLPCPAFKGTVMTDMNRFTIFLFAKVFPTPPVPFAAASLASAHFAVPRVHLVFLPSLCKKRGKPNVDIRKT